MISAETTILSSDDAVSADSTSEPPASPRSPVLQVVLTALAFGCLLGFSRTLATGFSGAFFVNSAPVAGLVSASCSWARFAALVVLTVLGCLHRPLINRATVLVSGILMAACGLVRVVVSALAVQIAMSAILGVASAVVMFALMLLLSSRSLKELVASSLGGLIVGGVLIALLTNAPAVPGTTVMVLAGLLPAFFMLGVDPKLECCEEQGELSRFELARFPWFSSIMLAATGFLGSLVYGIATTLSWGNASETDFVVMALAALITIVFTAAIILLQDNWVHTVWVPYLILLGCALAFLCTSGQTISPVAMGLLFALIMSYHFLRWLVFPAIVSTSLLPRVLTNGIFLVLTNSIFNVDMGVALAGVLPTGLQTPTGLGGTVSLLLAVVFAIIMFVERMNRYTDDEVYVAPEGISGASAALARESSSSQVASASQEPSELAGAEEEHAPEAAPREEPLTLEQRCEKLAEGKSLTTRESQIFSWTARGYSSSAIAEKLHISSSTVRFHQQNLYKKLGVHSKQELIQLVADL